MIHEDDERPRKDEPQDDDGNQPESSAMEEDIVADGENQPPEDKSEAHLVGLGERPELLQIDPPRFEWLRGSSLIGLSRSTMAAAGVPVSGTPLPDSSGAPAQLPPIPQSESTTVDDIASQILASRSTIPQTDPDAFNDAVLEFPEQELVTRIATPPAIYPPAVRSTVGEGRSRTRYLNVEVQVTLSNAERISRIAVEAAKRELRHTVNARMLEVEDKLFEFRQTMRTLYGRR